MECNDYKELWAVLEASIFSATFPLKQPIQELTMTLPSIPNDPIEFGDDGAFAPSARHQAVLAIICDALNRDQDSSETRILTEADFHAAYSELGILADGGEGMTWKGIYDALSAQFLNAEKIQTFAPWAELFIEFYKNPETVEDKQMQEKMFWASLMWLGDQLRALPHNIKVIPKLARIPETDIVIYTQSFEPMDIEVKGNIAIFPGSTAGPFIYSEMALEGAKRGFRVVTSDDPTGAYSSGYPWHGSDKRTEAWGSHGSLVSTRASAAAADAIADTWEFYSADKPFVWAAHSWGLIRVLSWLKHSTRTGDPHFKGVIELAGGWGLTSENRFQLLPFQSVDGGWDFPFSQFALETALKGSNGTDPHAVNKLIPVWIAAHAQTSVQHYHDVYEWDQQRGILHDELAELKITNPWVAIVAPLDDQYSDPMAFVERLGARLAGNNQVQVVALGSNGVPGDEEGDRREDLQEFRKAIRHHSHRFRIDRWVNRPVGHLMSSSPEAMTALYDHAESLLEQPMIDLREEAPPPLDPQPLMAADTRSALSREFAKRFELGLMVLLDFHPRLLEVAGVSELGGQLGALFSYSLLEIPGLDVIAGIFGGMQDHPAGWRTYGRPFLGLNLWYADVEATFDFDDRGVRQSGLGFGFRNPFADRFGPIANHLLLHFQFPGLFNGDRRLELSLGLLFTWE